MGKHERLDCFSQKETEKFIVNRMVVKIGSSAITADGRYLDEELIDDIARQASILFHSGVKIAIVSSGAIPYGKVRLRDFNVDFESKLSEEIAAAGVGQIELMKAWVDAFGQHNKTLAGQVLIPESGLNSLYEFLPEAMKLTIPIINGDDVTNAAINKNYKKVYISGDNDRLAGFVAKIIGADTCIFLTDVDGVLDKNGEVIKTIDGEDYRIVNRNNRKPIRDRNRYDDAGTGGMESKVKAAGQVARSGVNAFITNGRTSNVLLRIARGENLGTRFVKGWMLY